MKNSRRKSRKFRPRKLLKRLFVLAVLLLIGTGFFWLGRTAFTLVSGLFNRPNWLKIAQAEQVTDIPSIAAEAVLLRQELVVLADKPGQTNLIVEPQQKVDSGQLVLELIDKDLLAQIDAEIQKLESGEQQGTANEQSLAAVTEKLIDTQDKLQQAVVAYQQALRSQAVQTYSALYNEMNKISQQAVQFQQDHQLLAKSRTDNAEQRQELEQRRHQAIVPVHAPASGTVYYWVDGLEEAANPTKISAGLWEQLQIGREGQLYTSDNDSKATAGNPVFKVAVDDKSYLLLQLTAADATVPLEWEAVSLCWLNEGQDALFSGTIVSNDDLPANQLLLLVDQTAALGLPRFLEVSLHKEGEIYCSVPLQAITSVDGQASVFVLEGTTVQAHAVEVLQQQGKKNVIVAGLSPGASFVLQPDGLSDGQDVTERLRK